MINIAVRLRSCGCSLRQRRIPYCTRRHSVCGQRAGAAGTGCSSNSSSIRRIISSSRGSGVGVHATRMEVVRQRPWLQAAAVLLLLRRLGRLRLALLGAGRNIVSTGYRGGSSFVWVNTSSRTSTGSTSTSSTSSSCAVLLHCSRTSASNWGCHCRCSSSGSSMN